MLSSHRPPVFVHDEMEIVGHDGHVYKGRRVKQTLPPVGMVHVVHTCMDASLILIPKNIFSFIWELHN